MKRSVSVDYLMSFKNRFINNEIDLSNESENVLWLSQNFFYHDFDGENSWRPILWEEKNGILVLNNDGGLLYDSSENAPAFMAVSYTHLIRRSVQRHRMLRFAAQRRHFSAREGESKMQKKNNKGVIALIIVLVLAAAALVIWQTNKLETQQGLSLIHI